MSNHRSDRCRNSNPDAQSGGQPKPHKNGPKQNTPGQLVLMNLLDSLSQMAGARDAVREKKQEAREAKEDQPRKEKEMDKCGKLSEQCLAALNDCDDQLLNMTKEEYVKKYICPAKVARSEQQLQNILNKLKSILLGQEINYSQSFSADEYILAMHFGPVSHWTYFKLILTTLLFFLFVAPVLYALVTPSLCLPDGVVADIFTDFGMDPAFVHYLSPHTRIVDVAIQKLTGFGSLLTGQFLSLTAYIASATGAQSFYGLMSAYAETAYRNFLYWFSYSDYVAEQCVAIRAERKLVSFIFALIFSLIYFVWIRSYLRVIFNRFLFRHMFRLIPFGEDEAELYKISNRSPMNNYGDVQTTCQPARINHTLRCYVPVKRSYGFFPSLRYWIWDFFYSVEDRQYPAAFMEGGRFWREVPLQSVRSVSCPEGEFIAGTPREAAQMFRLDGNRIGPNLDGMVIDATVFRVITSSAYVALQTSFEKAFDNIVLSAKQSNWNASNWETEDPNMPGSLALLSCYMWLHSHSMFRSGANPTVDWAF